MRGWQALRLCGTRIMAGVPKRWWFGELRAPTGSCRPILHARHMPSLHLIQHEWTTHGTYSGLDANAYFASIRKAFTATKIPAQFASTSKQLTLSPSQIEGAFQ